MHLLAFLFSWIDIAQRSKIFLFRAKTVQDAQQSNRHRQEEGEPYDLSICASSLCKGYANFLVIIPIQSRVSKETHI